MVVAEAVAGVPSPALRFGPPESFGLASELSSLYRVMRGCSTDQSANDISGISNHVVRPRAAFEQERRQPRDAGGPAGSHGKTIFAQRGNGHAATKDHPRDDKSQVKEAGHLTNREAHGNLFGSPGDESAIQEVQMSNEVTMTEV